MGGESDSKSCEPPRCNAPPPGWLLMRRAAMLFSSCRVCPTSRRSIELNPPLPGEERGQGNTNNTHQSILKLVLISFARDQCCIPRGEFWNETRRPATLAPYGAPCHGLSLLLFIGVEADFLHLASPTVRYTCRLQRGQSRQNLSTHMPEDRSNSSTCHTPEQTAKTHEIPPPK